MTVSDASQLCAARRVACVLVVSEDEHLTGVLTAKGPSGRARSRTDAERRSGPARHCRWPRPAHDDLRDGHDQGADGRA